jgi:hypothetical protein
MIDVARLVENHLYSETDLQNINIDFVNKTNAKFDLEYLETYLIGLGLRNKYEVKYENDLPVYIQCDGKYTSKIMKAVKLLNKTK